MGYKQQATTRVRKERTTARLFSRTTIIDLWQSSSLVTAADVEAWSGKSEQGVL